MKCNNDSRINHSILCVLCASVVNILLLHYIIRLPSRKFAKAIRC